VNQVQIIQASYRRYTEPRPLSDITELHPARREKPQFVQPITH